MDGAGEWEALEFGAWDFGNLNGDTSASQYPAAPKRLVNVRADGKKKSNKSLSHHQLADLLDKPVSLRGAKDVTNGTGLLTDTSAQAAEPLSAKGDSMPAAARNPSSEAEADGPHHAKKRSAKTQPPGRKGESGAVNGSSDSLATAAAAVPTAALAGAPSNKKARKQADAQILADAAPSRGPDADQLQKQQSAATAPSNGAPTFASDAPAQGTAKAKAKAKGGEAKAQQEASIKAPGKGERLRAAGDVASMQASADAVGRAPAGKAAKQVQKVKQAAGEEPQLGPGQAQGKSTSGEQQRKGRMGGDGADGSFPLKGRNLPKQSRQEQEPQQGRQKQGAQKQGSQPAGGSNGVAAVADAGGDGAGAQLQRPAKKARLQEGGAKADAGAAQRPAAQPAGGKLKAGKAAVGEEEARQEQQEAVRSRQQQGRKEPKAADPCAGGAVERAVGADVKAQPAQPQASQPQARKNASQPQPGQPHDTPSEPTGASGGKQKGPGGKRARPTEADGLAEQPHAEQPEPKQKQGRKQARKEEPQARTEGAAAAAGPVRGPAAAPSLAAALAGRAAAAASGAAAAAAIAPVAAAAVPAPAQKLTHAAALAALQQRAAATAASRPAAAADGAGADGAAERRLSVLGGARKQGDKKVAAGGGGFLDKMRARLAGGRFRYLNEELYTRSGGDAFALMQSQPELFSQYHDGFQRQTRGWPKQPVDVAIAWLKAKRSEVKEVADFGCGDAKIAASVPQTVHSFDLIASAPGVIACNMADVPLPDAAVDAAVFSLALMGTDYGSYIEEAVRVLKPKGWLWIAEVRSRFAQAGSDAEDDDGSDDDSEGGGGGRACKRQQQQQQQRGRGGEAAGEEDFRPFLACLKRLGLRLVSQDANNKMFVVWVLRKGEEAKPAKGKGKGGSGISWPPLKACVYKKR